MITALTALFLFSTTAGGRRRSSNRTSTPATPHRHDEREQRKNPVPMTEQSVREGRELYAKHSSPATMKIRQGRTGVPTYDNYGYME